MYNSSNISIRIKNTLKEKNIKLNQMVEDCEFGRNILSQMNGGRMPLSDTLAVIADYLDVSVDYLLGRTDNPQSHK